MNYFYPYKYVLDRSWDNTFYDIVPKIAGATSSQEFKAAFVQLSACLNDAHLENSTLRYPNLVGGYYCQLMPRYASGKYVATRGYGSIKVGDEIVSVDGLTTKQWEDSLRPYISAGNDVVFRRFVSAYMMAGKYGSFNLDYINDAGSLIHYTQNRSYGYYNQYPPQTSEYIRRTKWKIFSCGIAYINPSLLDSSQVQSIYNQVKDYPYLIIDMRYNIPSAVLAKLSNNLYGKESTFAKFTDPNVRYPGTYTYATQQIGYNNPDPYKGKVILLSYEDDQSYLEYCMMSLQQLPDAITIGSQTTGADGNISVANGIFSNYNFHFTSIGVYYPNGDSTQRIGVGPRKSGDVLAQLTQERVRVKGDDILEAALKEAGCPLNTEEINAVMSGATIYPNPTTGTFSVEVDKNTTATVSIFSQTGQLVLQINQTENIDISSLPAGTYMVNIISNNITTTQKLIKQ